MQGSSSQQNVDGSDPQVRCDSAFAGEKSIASYNEGKATGKFLRAVHYDSGPMVPGDSLEVN